jgi:hypothetical protein
MLFFTVVVVTTYAGAIIALLCNVTEMQKAGELALRSLASLNALLGFTGRIVRQSGRSQLAGHERMSSKS